MAPIHAAAQAGQKACLEYMVKGASVSVRSRADDGATPAHFAAASGQVECLEWILDNGGSVLDRDNLGGTPVHDAAEQGQVNALTYLLERGVDVNTKDNEGLKPVDLAKENNHEEAYTLLFRVARPKLLTSMEPDHSLSRASGLLGEQKEIMNAEEKQKVDAMAGAEKDHKMEQHQENTLTIQSAQDSEAAASSVSVPAASSGQSYPHAVDKQRRRSSTGFYKSIDIQKDSSPDVEDINAAILKTMETHELDTEEEKGMVLRKKNPVSPPMEKLRKQQPLQKKSFFSFFSSPPKGGEPKKKPVKTTLHKDQTDAGEEISAPSVPIKVAPIKNVGEEGKPVLPASKSTKSPARPTSPVKKKVVKKRVVKKTKSPIHKQGRPQKGITGDNKLKDSETNQQVPPSPQEILPKQSVQVAVRTSEESPTEKTESRDLEISEPPSSPPPIEPVKPQPFIITGPTLDQGREINEPKDIEVKEKTSSAKSPKVSSSISPVSATTPKPNQEKKARAAKPMPIQIGPPKKPHKSSVGQKSPTSISEPRSPVTAAMPKHPSAQKRQVKRRPVSNTPRRRVASSSSALPRPVSSPKKRPLSPKKPRPVSADVGGHRFPFGKIWSGNKERNVKKSERSIVHSVSDMSLKTNNDQRIQAAEGTHEKIGETVANNLVKGVLADLAEDPNSTSKEKQKAPEIVVEKVVQEVLKEAVTNLERSNDASQDNTPFIPSPPPPPPLPLQAPPSPPYVFTMDHQPQESPEKLLGEEKDELETRQKVATEERVVDVSDESFIISFVAGKPEDREKYDDHSSSKEKSKEKILTHKEKLEMEQAKLRRKRESVRSSWEEKWIYRGPLDSALYSKIHEFQKQRVERGYTDVLKKADDFQASSSTTSITDSDTDKEETPEVVQGGKLSDRLKLFGGAAGFVKTTPAKEKKIKKKKTKKDKEVTAMAESDKSQDDKDADAGSMHAESALPKHLDGDLSDPKLMLRGSSPRRRSSSCVSVTAFATIDEEGQGNMEESTESLDRMTPLPKIGPSLSRRQSVELLKLDGRLKQDKEDDQVGEQPSDSKTASASRIGLERKESVPSIDDPKAIYMNSANLPYINKERDVSEQKEIDRLKDVINSLTSEPRSTGYLRHKFQGLNPDDKSKVQIWQYNDKTVQSVGSIKAVDFGSSEIYLFFEVRQNGPLLFHAYLWLGVNISRQRLDGVNEQMQNLIQCLPGKAVIHREFYGYESMDFHQMLGAEGVKQLTAHHSSIPSYVNPELSQSTLMTYSGGEFKRVDFENCNYYFVLSSKNSLILNSPTGIYLWLPESYWEEQLKKRQEAVLKISEKFISIHSLPKWTPVVAMTQDAEVPSFCDQFPEWPMKNLSSTHESHKIRLPSLKPPKISYPVTGQLKVWTIVSNELQAVGVAELGRFYSDQVHVVHYSYPKQSALYTWMDGVVYIWLGSAIQNDRDSVLKKVGEKLPAVMSASNLPTVIVPEGLEPPELLYLFKGKFIIKKSSKSQGSQLYKLSGHNAMSIKTEEVPVHASSLHSYNTFCLVVDGSPSCVWTGQFAEKTLRRAALVVVKAVSKSKQILVMSEGLEVRDFWQHLGGTGKYIRYNPVPGVDYISPRLYSTNILNKNATFTEMNATKRDELDTKTCYILVYRDQILIRVGKENDKQVVPTQILKSYVHQYCGFKTEDNFVVTVVHEGLEGEIFWKWFGFQEPNVAQDEPNLLADLPQDDTRDLKDNNSEEVEVEVHEQVASYSGDAHVISDPADLQLPEEVARLVEPINEEELSADKSKFLEQMANETTDELNSMISDILGSTGNPISMSSAAMASTSEVVTTTSKPVEKQSEPEINVPDVSSVKSSEAVATEKTKEEENELTKKVQPPSAKKKKPTSATPVVDLLIFIAELDKPVQIRVKESANVLSVLFKAADAGGIKVKENYALFETFEALKIQKALEDHEIIKDVMALWPREEVNKPILTLKIFPSKNQLWTKSTPIPKEKITAWTKEGVPPDVGMKLHCLKRGLIKHKWVQERYVVVKSGMAHEEEDVNRTTLTLACGLDHTLYVPFNEQGNVDYPTPFCFIMKPPNLWKEKDMKRFCTADAKTLSQWIQAVRLMKHGLQLKGNYLAMKKRVDAVRAKELLKESTTLRQQ